MMLHLKRWSDVLISEKLKNTQFWKFSLLNVRCQNQSDISWSAISQFLIMLKSPFSAFVKFCFNVFHLNFEHWTLNDLLNLGYDEIRKKYALFWVLKTPILIFRGTLSKPIVLVFSYLFIHKKNFCRPFAEYIFFTHVFSFFSFFFLFFPFFPLIQLEKIGSLY